MSYLTGVVSQLGIFDEDRTVLWRPEWAYWCRGVHLVQFASQYVGLWSSSMIRCGDPSSPAGMLGLDSCQGGLWSVWQSGLPGKGGPSVFLTGRTLDTNGSPLAGVTVEGFRTSDNLFVGQTTSDANGNYSLGSPYTTAHYLVAYLPGSPDIAGTTANTLTPA